VTQAPKPPRPREERRTEKYRDDPQKRREHDEPPNPEASGSAKALEVEDLDASNDK
jgi:hypothetical protein